MNVLLLTNHLKDYAGSEIQILELYKFFKQRGDNVKVYANLIGNPISQHFDSNDLFLNIENIVVSEYQFIWSQHGIFPLLFSTNNIPFSTIVCSVHLSPFENMELLQIPYMKSIGAYFVANSLETKEKLCNLGVKKDDIFVSYNCAPSYFRSKQQAASSKQQAASSKQQAASSKQQAASKSIADINCI